MDSDWNADHFGGSSNIAAGTDTQVMSMESDHWFIPQDFNQRGSAVHEQQQDVSLPEHGILEELGAPVLSAEERQAYDLQHFPLFNSSAHSILAVDSASSTPVVSPTTTYNSYTPLGSQSPTFNKAVGFDRYYNPPDAVNGIQCGPGLSHHAYQGYDGLNYPALNLGVLPEISRSNDVDRIEDQGEAAFDAYRSSPVDLPNAMTLPDILSVRAHPLERIERGPNHNILVPYRSSGLTCGASLDLGFSYNPSQYRDHTSYPCAPQNQNRISVAMASTSTATQISQMSQLSAIPRFPSLAHHLDQPQNEGFFHRSDARNVGSYPTPTPATVGRIGVPQQPPKRVHSTLDDDYEDIAVQPVGPSKRTKFNNGVSNPSSGGAHLETKRRKLPPPKALQAVQPILASAICRILDEHGRECGTSLTPENVNGHIQGHVDRSKPVPAKGKQTTSAHREKLRLACAWNMGEEGQQMISCPTIVVDHRGLKRHFHTHHKIKVLCPVPGCTRGPMARGRPEQVKKHMELAHDIRFLEGKHRPKPDAEEYTWEEVSCLAGAAELLAKIPYTITFPTRSVFEEENVTNGGNRVNTQRSRI
ncbi:hypothetical protein EV368DRAFT_63222 [Lentinula lateritia]|nr:hypothetical protein EV368DRAFT_63222 [Lentinula lateritia]